MLSIPRGIYLSIMINALMGLPHESCGLLGGKGRNALKFYPLTNTDESREHFSMDPAEQFAAVKDMRAAGLEMIAIYHSHPETPARPSEEDIRLAHTPGVSYIIVSMARPGTPVLKSFLIEDGEVTEEAVEILEGGPANG
ncbi:MAG TPA: M67 family metallopeptidase [Nitrospirota bacterium]